MPMPIRKIKELESKLVNLSTGKVVEFVSQDADEIKGIKSFYKDTYNVFGPNKEEDGIVLTFTQKYEKFYGGQNA